MLTATKSARQSRARRVLVFLAVVWSIGGVFLALEAGMTELSWFGSSTFGSSTSLSASLVLPKQSQAASVHCQEVVNSLPPAPNAGVDTQAWYLTWRLGYLLGSADASLTSGMMDRVAAENELGQSLPATTALGIPPLTLPEHGRSAYAIREFSVFLEEDTPCVAAVLQFRHSPSYAALYKFGATVGFGSVYRRLAPDLNDVLAPQLRIYGSAAGIPADLYDPLLAQHVADSGTEAGQAAQSVVNRIDSYIKSTR